MPGVLGGGLVVEREDKYLNRGIINKIYNYFRTLFVSITVCFLYMIKER